MKALALAEPLDVHSKYKELTFLSHAHDKTRSGFDQYCMSNNY